MRAGLGRLKRRSDFLQVAGARRKWAAPGLVLQVLEHGPGTDHGRGPGPRVGFTASRKVGNAVARNRARRRLRAAAREVMPDAARPGHDYVIIARGATLVRPYRALVGDLEEAMRRLGAYRDAGEGAPVRESTRSDIVS
jgi:ribonuclease P protein component